jgi:hypothetical protein
MHTYLNVREGTYIWMMSCWHKDTIYAHSSLSRPSPLVWSNVELLVLVSLPAACVIHPHGLAQHIASRVLLLLCSLCGIRMREPAQCQDRRSPCALRYASFSFQRASFAPRIPVFSGSREGCWILRFCRPGTGSIRFRTLSNRFLRGLTDQKSTTTETVRFL